MVALNTTQFLIMGGENEDRKMGDVWVFTSTDRTFKRERAQLKRKVHGVRKNFVFTGDCN